MIKNLRNSQKLSKYETNRVGNLSSFRIHGSFFTNRYRDVSADQILDFTWHI